MPIETKLTVLIGAVFILIIAFLVFLEYRRGAKQVREARENLQTESTIYCRHRDH